MALTKQKIEGVLVQAAAVLQRYEQINQLCNALRGGMLYRSPDGGIAIELTADQLSQAEKAIVDLLDDADTASVSIRGILAAP